MRADAVQQLRECMGPTGCWSCCRGCFACPFPCPQPLRELNAYLIRGRREACSLTRASGSPRAARLSRQGCVPAGAEHDPLDVLLTHIHTDHTGLASEVVRPGAPSISGGGDYPFTSRAWEEEYWGRIDQRFLQEGFPRRSA